MTTTIYYPTVGGGARYQKDVVDYFRKKGDIIDVLTISTDKNMYLDSNAQGSIVRLPKLGQINSAIISLPFSYLFGRLAPGYDILHFNFPNGMAEIAALYYKKKLKHVKKVVFYHADIVPAKRFSGIYNKLVTSRFLKLMDQIIVSSPKLAEFSPHLRPFRHKVTVIPFGIDINHYVPPKTNQFSDDKVFPKILFVGRLSRYKGLDYLIQAMKDAPGRLSIVGTGPLKEILIKLRDSLGLTDQIEFCGYVSEETLLKKYKQADILVLSSTDAGEAFGYVLIEAMACRTAVISTELNTGTSYVNVNGETGFVVSPKNVDELHNALKSLCNDPKMLENFKDNALRRTHQYFSLDNMLAKTEELYCKIESTTVGYKSSRDI
jgi:glycosyltransferase involved in cell wall biosynthesis